jgi:hypothetical protein
MVLSTSHSSEDTLARIRVFSGKQSSQKVFMMSRRTVRPVRKPG